jgi:hypothetical protein
MTSMYFCPAGISFGDLMYLTFDIGRPCIFPIVKGPRD